MWEEEDELGNRCWVSSTLVELAKWCAGEPAAPPGGSRTEPGASRCT